MAQRNNPWVVSLSAFIFLFIVAAAIFNYKISHEVDSSEPTGAGIIPEFIVSGDGPAKKEQPSFAEPDGQSVKVSEAVPTQEDKLGSDKVVREAPLSSVLLLN